MSAMRHPLVDLLGKMLDEVIELDFVGPFQERPHAELIHDTFYVALPRLGIALVASMDGRLSCVQLFSEGHEGYTGFRDPLPEGLSFVDSRQLAWARLGTPAASGGGVMIAYLGEAAVWDRFDRQDHAIHLQYKEGEGGIALISLLRPDAVPT